MILRLYRTLTNLGWPLISLYMKQRLQRGKEDPERFDERLGRSAVPRPEGRLVWLHGASVGEAASLMPIIQALHKRPGLSLMVTTGTVTSAQLMDKVLPEGVLHQFVPVDRYAYAQNFLDHWQPDLVLWTESDFWPNLLNAISNRRIPMVLLQGRISEKSFNSWCKIPGASRRLLSGFSLCLAQTEGDAERLEFLGAPRVECHGNLKMAAPPLPCNFDYLEALQAIIGNRPVWLAASTHSGEEEVAGHIHRRLQREIPNLLTIVAPRHPVRGEAIANSLRTSGLTVARRSQPDDTLDEDTDIYLVDTMGEMGLFYRLSPITFMGKSLLAKGGHNPFEPALLGSAVLFGPNMGNFPDMVPSMLKAGAAEVVRSEMELSEAVRRLLLDKDGLAQRRLLVQDWARTEADVLPAILTAIEPFVTALSPPVRDPASSDKTEAVDPETATTEQHENP